MKQPEQRNRRFARHATVLLWLLCVGLSSISVIAVEPLKRSDVVFCPLQKKWIKKSEPTKALSNKPLSDICGSNKNKKQFLNLLSASVLTRINKGKKVDTGILFINFRAVGERAFAEIPNYPDVPKVPLAIVEKVPVSSGGGRGGNVAATAETIPFEQFSRPPTHDSASKFFFHSVNTLQLVTFAINTRGSPLS